ncbi:diguanylate cyclase [Clostridium sp. YIM B02515]|uniref:Diguanylate cyclase n=1 Tax=Clostridium rhizosphaerae TaxID=2803861 RepID=A0ABS1TDX6_9CLOT|nr:diguanylate cyclase [Clostridium rhizosphaerae]MBL4937535.1 diguanylate cyclase [Clostridium rhizosphaerae]
MNSNDMIKKIDELNNCAEDVIRHKPIRSIELSNEAYELSKHIEYKIGTLKSLLILGKSSYIVGNFEKAIIYLMDALEIAKIENFKEYQADLLNILGNVNLALANYNLALEYYMKSLDIIRNIGYKKSQSGVLNNIGEIYKDLKNYEIALDYYTESLELCSLANNENVECIVIQNIGEVYYYLNNFNMAEKYTEKSLNLSRKVKDRMIEAACLHQLGKIVFKQNNSDKALNLFLKSLEISKETEERYFIISVMIDIYKLLIRMNNNDEAIEYLEKALIIAHEINSKEMIMKIYSYLAKNHEKIGKLDKALYYYKKFHDEERKGINEEIAHKLKNITMQFKMEQSHQEKEIYRLKNVELKEKTEALEKKTTELIESYNNMKTISEIGQNITSTLDFEKILNLVYKSINDLMQAYAFGIALYDKSTENIEYSLFIENSIRYPVFKSSINNKNTWAAWCILNKKEVLINDVEKEYRNYIQDRNFIHGTKAGSLIYCPLIFEDSVLGVITVQSISKNAYSQYNLDTVKALASYIAIAIRNAQKSNDLEKLNKKLLGLSNLDGLTKIPNRRYFDEELEILWESSKVNREPLSLMLIDVDNFKEYNDNYGHLLGDYCLQQVASTLQSVLNNVDGFVARYGGDEFVGVFPNTSSDAAFSLAETMKSHINALNIEHKFSKVSDHITLTFGICTLMPDENLKISSLTDSADKALYSAKQKGRNTIAVY